MPWRHQGRRVRITRNIDLGNDGGIIRRGERGRVTFANREEGIYDIEMNKPHEGLLDNLLCIAPFDDSISPHVKRDRVMEAVAFARDRGAVLAVGGFLVGVATPSPLQVQASAENGLPQSYTRLMEQEGHTYRVTVEITRDGKVELVKDIDLVQSDEQLPIVEPLPSVEP